jgi:hypothetical protein
MADVLFQRGAKFANEMWDDSELIASWNRQLDAAAAPAHQEDALQAAQSRRRQLSRDAAERKGDVPAPQGEEGEEGDSLASSAPAYNARHGNKRGDDESSSGDNGTSANDAPLPAVSARKRQRPVAVAAVSDVPMPPPPRWADERTRQLLAAWFNAGYWTGVATQGAA